MYRPNKHQKAVRSWCTGDREARTFSAMPRHNEQSVRDILRAVFQDYRLDDKLLETQIKQGWPEWMGPAVARYTDSMQFRRGELEIRFTSATLRQEYRMQAERLRAKINEHLGKELVKKVAVR